MTDDEDAHEEKVDRNLEELLQELRVTQTGVQILTAFLLTVPFTQVFARLNTEQVTLYLVTLCGAVISTGLVVAPVAFHRALFGDDARERLMRIADRLARAGLTTLSLTMCGAVALVFDVATTRLLAIVAAAVALVFFAVLWLVLPLRSQQEASD